MQRLNFNSNFQTFILSNGLSYQDAADMLNRELVRLDAKDERIYMSNDIWTIVGRGSTPRNHLVLVAIANVIGKPLDNLILNVYEMSDLYRPDLKKTKTKDSSASFDKNGVGNCNIAELFEQMSPEDRDFVLELVYSMEKEKDSVYLYCLVTIDMPLDGLIDVGMYQRDGSDETSNLLSDWAAFATHLKACNYDPCAMLADLVKDPLLFPFTEGLRVNVTPAGVTRYRDEDAAETDPYFENAYMVKMKVDLDRDGLLFLYKKSVERLKKQMAEEKAKNG